MKKLTQHHHHIIGHLGLAIMGILGSIAGLMLNSQSTSAQIPTLFEGYFSGRDAQQADIHWNYGGNDFEGIVFWGDHEILDTPAIVTLDGDTKSCERQVRGLYYNSARGQVFWPLDAGSLDALRLLDDSYDDLSITGGLYIGCDGDTEHVFGQVSHTINERERKIVAGVQIETGTNSYNYAFGDSLSFSAAVAGGYLVDSVGGVADVSGFTPLYQEGSEPEVDYCPNGDTSPSFYDGLCEINICETIEVVFACTIDPYGLMNLCPSECAQTQPQETQTGDTFTGTQATIVGTGNSGDIVTVTVGGQSYTGVVGSGGTFEIPVVLTVGSNEVVITITDPETEESTQRTITVTAAPTPVDYCPNGDYTASIYDGLCGQAPAQNQSNNGRKPPTLMTDEDLGICEEGKDDSDSYYDRICKDPTHNSPEEEPKNPILDDTFNFVKEVGNVMKSMTCDISQELVEAYVFGHNLNMTTINNICNANLLGPLRRKEMAKFSSIFALKVLGKEPDKEKSCIFADADDESNEMKAFITLSCELGNMGLKRSGVIDEKFRPNDKVTIGEFATLVSRMVFGPIHNTPENDPRPWYQEHTKALKQAGIMTQIDKPSDEQIRGYALIVFKRVYDMLNK